MKTLKWIFFLVLITLSFLFLFKTLNLKFVVFHLTLLFIFFFPFHFWVQSLGKLLLISLVVFIVSSALFFAVQKLPDKKLELNLPSPVMGVEPQISKVFFNFAKQHYAYDFENKTLSSEKEADAKPLIIDSPIFQEYFQFSNDYMRHFVFQPLSLKTVSLLLWIYSSILIAFIFSYRTSLLVSYSNIIFMIPYTFFAALNFYFKPVSLLWLGFQGGFFVALLLFSMVRVRH